MWMANGVYVSKDPVQVNDTFDITYAGLLRNDGADGVLVHYGVDGWKNARDEWMTRQPDGTFRCSLSAAASHEVNFCFKDTAANWDNNSGWNWKVRVI